MDELQLFGGDDVIINDHVTIHHPTLKDIRLIGEESYFHIAATFCKTPADHKSELFDRMGVYWDEMDEFFFWSSMVSAISLDESKILFGDLNFEELKLGKDPDTEEMCLLHPAYGVAITKKDYELIVEVISKIHYFKVNHERAGNDETRKYMIDKDRRMLQRERRRKKKKKKESILLPLISSLVNCNHFKYDHFTVWDLPIYTFMDSVKRIQKIKNFDALMQGIYSGCVDTKKIDDSALNWMGAISE